MVTDHLGVVVIGCGLIGRRRAEAAAAHPRSRLVAVVDVDAGRVQALAGSLGAAAEADWRAALERPDVNAVVVATPNGLLAEIGCAALRSGRHVLLEKPMGRGYAEARELASVAERSGRLLKVGFNHRYHPAIERAHAIAAEGGVGRIVHLRARYGHGARPGCEREWRADPEQAGGGELTDQGVHLTDLFHWFAGVPTHAFGLAQTAVWPLAPLEDNGYGLFRFRDGAVGQLHASMNQWKNLFSLEVAGEDGALVVEGLGGSYGTERLTQVRRRREGGAPDVEVTEFPGPDGSWTVEWDDFVAGVLEGREVRGSAADGVAAMRMVDALYRSAASGAMVEV